MRQFDLRWRDMQQRNAEQSTLKNGQCNGRMTAHWETCALTITVHFRLIVLFFGFCLVQKLERA
jgi:hypothetical protein